MATSTTPAPILFMTNSEVGQENVVLATALEVARDPAYRVHFAAFALSESRIAAINSECKFLAGPITFHKLQGPSISDTVQRVVKSVAECTHPPGFWPAIRSYQLFAKSMLSWKPDEYVAQYKACVQIIQDVKPTALVIENALVYARDAALTLGLEFLIIAPCSAKEIVGAQLPGAPNMLRWPMPSSGYQVPLSFVDRIKNTLLVFGFVLVLLSSSTIPAIDKARKLAGIDSPQPFKNPYVKKGVQYLLPFLPETEYADLKDFTLPTNILPCGPITLPSLHSMHEADAALLQWLEKRPTILVNLGSIWEPDAENMLEMLTGLKFVLVSRPDVQILWKLKKRPAGADAGDAIIQEFAASERLRITPWLNINPSTIVESGHVLCSVHHGGANSYYEACKAGVIQLVLPVWIDTYEFAERARHLGLGLIGNVGAAPGVESQQLGDKLLRVLNEESFQRRATEVRDACRTRGEGREIAASAIIRWAEEGRSAKGLVDTAVDETKTTLTETRVSEAPVNPLKVPIDGHVT